MTVDPWSELVILHQDILDRTFIQDGFATSLTKVVESVHASDNQYSEDLDRFLARNYITAGMREIVTSVAKQITSNEMGSSFLLNAPSGSGKTHLLIVLFHLLKQERSLFNLAGIFPLLEQVGISDLPSMKLAVIDGKKFSITKQIKKDNITINTLWGEIAWQLLGEIGFKIFENADKNGICPLKSKIEELVNKCAHCAIIIDNLDHFLNQFLEKKTYPVGTLETNLNFLKSLNEIIKSTPNSVMLMAYDEDEIRAEGFDKIIDKSEVIWKKATSDEEVDIIKLRLLESVAEPIKIQKICKSFLDFYKDNDDKFPIETQSNEYLEKMIQAYPFHPQLIFLLQNNWAKLKRFQSLRGILNYLSVVVLKLQYSQTKEALIMPASIPLDDRDVLTITLQVLPKEWQTVVLTDVDGKNSYAFDIDVKDTKFTAINAARRMSRSIFLSTAITLPGSEKKGIDLPSILLSVCQPDQVLGTYQDVLKRLNARLQFFYSEENRIWFEKFSSIRFELEARKQKINYEKNLLPLIRDELQSLLLPTVLFPVVHIFPQAEEVVDELGVALKLIVLLPNNESAYAKNNLSVVKDKICAILNRAGTRPRKKRNRLIFLIADQALITKLIDTGKNFLAFQSMKNDLDIGKLILDQERIHEVMHKIGDHKRAFLALVPEVYKWIVNPVEVPMNGKVEAKWKFSSISSNFSLGKTMAMIEAKVRGEEWFLDELSPQKLTNILTEWYFKDGRQDVVTQKLFDDFSELTYLPKIMNDEILKKAIWQGVMSTDFFGYAQSKDENQYSGLVIGNMGTIRIDENTLLVKKEVANAQKKKF